MIKMNRISKRIISVGLAITMTAGLIGYISLDRNPITAQAAEDTLSGVEILRNSFMESGEDYTILEIVPDVHASEIGFYIDGMEPVLSNLLYTPGTGVWKSWEDKLKEMASKEERTEFMNTQLKPEVLRVMGQLKGDGEPPFTWMTGTDSSGNTVYIDYQEFDASEVDSYPGYHTLSVSEMDDRGYLRPADPAGTGDWNPVFRWVDNKNSLTLDEVNSGTNTPYYRLSNRTDLTYADLQNMYENNNTAILYSFRYDTYFVYEGSIIDVWNKMFLNGEITVSGNDEADREYVFPGDKDSYSGYSIVTFDLINNIPENQITEDQAIAGVELYTIDLSRTEYVAGEGEYSFSSSNDGNQAGLNFHFPGETIYFVGGIENMDYFRRFPLGLSEPEEREKFHIQVVTMTPGMLNNLSGENFEKLGVDFVYLGRGSLYTGMENTDATYFRYDGSNDLTAGAAEMVFSYVAKNVIPCIVDLSVSYEINGSAGYNAFQFNSTHGDNRFYSEWNIDTLSSALMYYDKTSLLNDARTGFGTINGTNAGVYCRNQFINDFNAGNYYDGSDHSKWDGTFVSEQTYVVNGDTLPLIHNVLFDDAANYSQEKIAGGFQPVLDEILVENQYRLADTQSNYAPLPEVVTDANSIRYILNYKNRRPTSKKTSFNVLEIQPAYTTSQLVVRSGNTTRNYVNYWTGIETNNIHVSTMQMNTFVGKIDDLNSLYDLIYIGSSTAGFNTHNNGTTNFRDDNMDGLLYSHVGDTTSVGYLALGLINTDLNGGNTSREGTNSATSRYAGNDITLEKYNALKEFLLASYPIVIDQGLLSNGAVNPARVDNSSYLYEFLTEALSKDSSGKAVYANVFSSADLPTTANGAKNSTFDFYANRAKLTLTDSELRNKIPNPYPENSAVNQDIPVINKQGDSYYLEITFTIQNAGAVSAFDKYKCQLFLDTNADGKFSLTNEELTGIEVFEAVSGNSVVYDSLVAGTKYVVRRKLTGDYLGCLTYQLMVSQSTNKYIRSVVKGYAKLKTDKPAIIKILQIYPSDTARANRCLRLDQAVGKYNGNINNPRYTGNSNNQSFNTYATQIINDYILDITAVSRQEFATAYQNGETHNSLTTTGGSIDPYYMEQYDMLILGFTDMYDQAAGDFADYDPNGYSIKVISDFMKSGKSVMMAHDFLHVFYLNRNQYTTNNGGRPNNVGNTSASRTLREMSGQDVYGITPFFIEEHPEYGVLKNGNTLNVASSGLPVPQKVDGFYTYGVKDLAFTPKSGRETTVPEVHGFGSYMLSQFLSTTNGMVSYRTNLNGFMATGMEWNTYATNTVSEVNQGQITNFPFKVSNNGIVPVKETHYQYNTLDMNGDADRDGQTDMVVWYCLSGGGVRQSGTYYDASPLDVRSNYYIYNYGNVTYTGMGHYAYSDGTTSVTSEEAKLFLNTMVAAYSAGTLKPSIITFDASGETDVFYGFMDSDLDIGTLPSDDSTVGVRFSIEDLNVAPDKDMQIRFYRQDDEKGEANYNLPPNPNTGAVQQLDSETKVVDCTKDIENNRYVRVDPSSFEMLRAMYPGEVGARAASIDGWLSVSYDSKGNITSAVVMNYDKLSANLSYSVDVPIRYFASGSEGFSSKLFFAVRSKITKSTSGDGIVRYSSWGTKHVTYMKAELFDLD